MTKPGRFTQPIVPSTEHSRPTRPQSETHQMVKNMKIASTPNTSTPITGFFRYPVFLTHTHKTNLPSTQKAYSAQLRQAPMIAPKWKTLVSSCFCCSDCKTSEANWGLCTWQSAKKGSLKGLKSDLKHRYKPKLIKSNT